MVADSTAPKPAATTLHDGFRVGDWVVLPLQGVIEQGKHRVHVEPRVMDVLLCLARHPGQVVTRDMLLDQVWPGVVVTDDVVTRCISELRTVLRDTGRERRFIRTIPKRGYSLLAQVKPLAIQAESAAAQASTSELTTTDSRAEDPPTSRPSALLSSVVDNTVRTTRRVLTTAHGLVRSALLGIGLIILCIIGLVLLFDSDDTPGVQVQIRSSDARGSQPAETAVDTTARKFDSVAVLPLLNLSGNPEHEYFSDGLAEDIRDALISVTSLRVAARTSSMAFRNRPMDVREIARQLNVDALLEGTVRIADKRLRVTTQLTDGRTGYPVWASSFERPVTDKLSLQTEVAQAIIQQLAPTIRPGTRLFARATGNEQALDDYLLGRYYWNQRTEPGIQRSIQYFERALSHDPGYAQAYSGLADAWSLVNSYRDQPLAEAEAKARQYANQAVGLNPDLAEAQASLGMVLRNGGDPKGALAAYQKAVTLQPGYSMGQMWLGALWLSLGDANKAARHLETALQLDPLHPSVQVNYVSSLIARGELERASEESQRLLALTPNSKLQKMLWHVSLEKGAYDKVLQLAVGQTSDVESRPYLNDAIIEALIYLQRYAEAEQMIGDNRTALELPQRLSLESSLAIARRDAPALRLIAEEMRRYALPAGLAVSSTSCTGIWADYRVAIADLFDKRYVAARRGFQRVARDFDPALCDEETASLGLMAAAYALESQTREKSTALPSDVSAARQVIERLNNRGWNDGWFATGALAVAIISGDEQGAALRLDDLRRRGVRPYGRLRTSPLFDRLWDLAPLQAATPQMVTDYEATQQRVAHLMLTKLGL